jgi:hypothetical protein
VVGPWRCRRRRSGAGRNRGERGHGPPRLWHRGRSWWRPDASATVVTDGGVVALAVVVVVAVTDRLAAGRRPARAGRRCDDRRGRVLAATRVRRARPGGGRRRALAARMGRVGARCAGAVRGVGPPGRRSPALPVEHEGDRPGGERAIRGVVTRASPAAARAHMARGRMGAGQWRASPARRRTGASCGVAARRRRVRSGLGQRRRCGWPRRSRLESCASDDRTCRGGASRTRWCAVPRSGDRRRPRSTSRHDRPVPGERVCRT